jgi:threonine dehydratase
MGVTTLLDVTAARARLAPHLRQTPVLATESFVFKLEQLQRTGSFKFRGAMNTILHHLEGTPTLSGVVAASGGNHGAGIALGASITGITATVFVPEAAPEVKVRAIVAAGATAVRFGANFSEARGKALEFAAEHGLPYIDACDDAQVIAGQATTTAELIEQAPDVDAIVVATGGGGLAAGAILAAGGRRVISAEPEGSQCLHQALIAGTPVTVEVNSIAQSALGSSKAGEIPFAILQDKVESLIVTDEEIIAAQQHLWDHYRLAVEPAAATAFAAYLGGQISAHRPGFIICGANSTWVAE